MSVCLPPVARYTCATATCGAAQYALKESLAKAAGVTSEQLSGMGFVDSRRRSLWQWHTDAARRRLRAGTVDIRFTITADDDISAKVVPAAFAAEYKRQYATVVKAMPPR